MINVRDDQDLSLLKMEVEETLARVRAANALYLSAKEQTREAKGVMDAFWKEREQAKKEFDSINSQYKDRRYRSEIDSLKSQIKALKERSIGSTERQKNAALRHNILIKAASPESG